MLSIRSVKFVAVVFHLVIAGRMGLCQPAGDDTGRHLYEIDSAAIATRSDSTGSFVSGLSRADGLLDSIMQPVDPLAIFPKLASMGSVTMPKGYLILLIGLLIVGGVMIFIADTVRASKRTKGTRPKKTDRADRVIRNFKIQSDFEAFVITLFDPLYFRYKRPKAERVLAGKIADGENGADLEFDFNHKGIQNQFAVKCQYFKHVILSGGRQLFSPGQYQLLRDFEGDNGMPLYIVLGFGGTPEDPKELFLLPATALRKGLVTRSALQPYSKSGMFFYNRKLNSLQ